jgi:hypothetical protein
MIDALAVTIREQTLGGAGRVEGSFWRDSETAGYGCGQRAETIYFVLLRNAAGLNRSALR